MFEYVCTVCGKRKMAPLDILALQHFVCIDCQQNAIAKARARSNEQEASDADN